MTRKPSTAPTTTACPSCWKARGPKCRSRSASWRPASTAATLDHSERESPAMSVTNGKSAAEDRLLPYKRDLHQQLIASMDLSTISTMGEEELRREVRRAAEELSQMSSNLL